MKTEYQKDKRSITKVVGKERTSKKRKVISKAEGLSRKGRTADAWPPGTEEGRTKRRNAAGSCKEAKIRRYPNGGTRHPGGMTPDTEHIGITGGTRGTETSKYPKEKKTKVIS